MSRKQTRKSRKRLRGGASSIQALELDADKTHSVVLFGSAKEHLIDDLNKGITALTSKRDALLNSTATIGNVLVTDGTSWNTYLTNEINQLSLLNSKSAKAISGGISSYNVFQRRLDNANPSLQREPKSTYPCGSTTCKERGQKIKDALIEIASYSPEALGSIGVAAVASNALDWTLKGVGLRAKPTNTVEPVNTPVEPANMPVEPVNASQPVTRKSWWSFGGRRTRRR